MLNGKSGDDLIDPQFGPGCCWEPPTSHGGKLFSPVTHGLICYKLYFSSPRFFKYSNIKSKPSLYFGATFVSQLVACTNGEKTKKLTSL